MQYPIPRFKDNGSQQNALALLNRNFDQWPMSTECFALFGSFNKAIKSLSLLIAISAASHAELAFCILATTFDIAC